MRSRWPGAVLASTTVLLAACSAQQQTADDLPTSSTVHAYRSQGGIVANVSELDVKPGQAAAFDAYIVNDSGHPVRVVGARVATVPGQRKAKLTNVALVQGRNAVGAQGWPPDNVRLRPLVGHMLPTGRSDLAVGITGRAAGNNLAAGVTLTIRDHGERYQATAWGGGVACIVKDMRSKKQHAACARSFDGAENTLWDYIHKQ